MPVKPSTWGPLIKTKDYVLQMEEANFFESLYTLPGYSLAAPEAETQDAVMIRTFTMEGGFLQEREFYARKSFNRAFSYELILAPGGTLWSPLDAVANSKGMCRRDFYATYLCPSDDRYAHFWRMPESVLDEILPTTMLIATTDDEEAMTHQTTLRTSKRMLYYALGATERSTVGSYPLYAVAYRFQNCQNCPADTHQYAVVGGGNGTAAPSFYSSSDRFATSSSITNSISSARFITDIYANGDIIAATFADKRDYDAATASAGGIVVSTDGGATTTIVSSPTTALYAITEGAGGYYWAVGKSGVIYRSFDLINWTQLTNGLGSSFHYTDIAYDKDTGYMYLSGFNGSASVAHRIDGDVVADITTQVNAGSNQLFRVAVLGKDHVVFGGVSGTVRESATASDGLTFQTVNVGGTTSIIRFIGGDRARTIVAAGTKIYERSTLTERIFSAITVNAGTTISGNITAAAMGEQFDGVNYILAVTDQFEVISINPYFPGA